MQEYEEFRKIALIDKRKKAWKKFRENHPESVKQHYEKNKEYCKEYSKEYYKKLKEDARKFRELNNK